MWNGGCVVETMYVHSLYPLHPDAEWESHPRLDLTLLRVCRQIYNEAVELPYATNIFDVDDLIDACVLVADDSAEPTQACQRPEGGLADLLAPVYQDGPRVG